MINLVRGSLAFMFAVAASATSAQDFSAKPIRLLVPTSTGTASDATARFVADRVGKELSTSVVVENRTGANGTLAIQQLLSSPGDGYTIMVMASGLYANPALYKNVQYDPGKDLKIVAPLNEVAFVMVAAPTFPVSNVKQLVDYAKQHPGDVTYASASVGSSTHLGPELFAARAGVKLRHIPYKGGAQAIQDTAGGQVNMAMTAVPTALPLIRAGKLRALAVTGTARARQMPEVPTLAESGIVGAEITSKQSIVVPSSTPEAIVAKLRHAFTTVTGSADYAKFLEGQGIDKEPLALDTYINFGPQETLRWAEIVRISGAKLD
jgi:tripartite-type tricarboxylate transporter receptor subunit TctC